MIIAHIRKYRMAHLKMWNGSGINIDEFARELKRIGGRGE